jgi:ATP-dependent protease Clp ATPase subunit
MKRYLVVIVYSLILIIYIKDMTANLRNIKIEDLFKEIKRRQECENKPRMNVVLVGPAGSGKGT